MTEKLLNLACGSKISETGCWTNVDFQSPINGVIEMDILKGLFFGPEKFDAVYSAQFFEHLTLKEAEKVLKNVFKIMKPGAVIRIVTPDLEELVKTYLSCLKVMRESPSETAYDRYQWARLEIFDQVVRDKSGGEMAPFLAQCDAQMREYILERIGYTAGTIFQESVVEPSNVKLARFFSRLHRAPTYLYRGLVSVLSSEVAQIGRFRRSGEVHRYLHDAFSLQYLLEQCGFHAVERMDPYRSNIPNWTSYELDVVGGVVDGPMSLYIEAIR